MAWTETTPTPTPILHIVDGVTNFYKENTEGLTLAQAMLDYAAQSENQDWRMVQIRQLTLGEAGPPEGCALPIPEEPIWNSGGPSSEMIPRFHVVDDSLSFNAVNSTGMSLEDGAAHYGAAFVAGTEFYVCENREPHEITIREISSAGNGPWSTFTVPVEPEE